jgi:hypothetical protein
MKTTKQSMMIALLTTSVALSAFAQAAPLTPEQAKEELAYTIGTQAYVYGYPWI